MTRAGKLAAALAAVLIALSASFAQAAAPPPLVLAKSAVLIDASSGVVLFDQGMHDRRPIASTTKIMTALVALESAGLDSVFTTTRTTLQPDGSRIGIKPGQQWKLDSLLVALLLKSANDAAVAIAEGVSGNVGAFAEKMNARAAALGAKDSHFVNPNGLFDPNHYSSAYDLALIAREAMKHPRFRELVATKSTELYNPELGQIETLFNHNRLLWRDPRVDGVKTGYVRQSGQCLVASETRGDWQLIAVVLDSPDVYGDTLNLFEYGFNNYEQRLFARRGEAVGQARVRYGKTPRVAAIAQRTLGAVVGEELPKARLDVRLDRVTAPVKIGTRLGEARLVVGDKVTAVATLVAAVEVPRSGFRLAMSWAWRLVLGLLAIALVVRVSAKLLKTSRRRRLDRQTALPLSRRVPPPL